MNRERWDEIGRRWQTRDLTPANGDAEWKRIAQVEARCIAERAPASIRTVLEVGCGFGRLTPWLAGVFPRVVATDQSMVMLAITSGVCAELENVRVVMPGTEPRCGLALVWGNMYDEDWSDEQAAEHGDAMLKRHGLLLVQTGRVWLHGYWQPQKLKGGRDWLLLQR